MTTMDEAAEHLAEVDNVNDMIARYTDESVQITMKIGQVIDIIECGVVAHNETGYKPAIIDELVELLGKLFGELDGATDEV